MGFKSLDAMPKAVRGVTAEEVADAKAAIVILDGGKVVGSDTFSDVAAARVAGTRLRNVISSLGYGSTLKLRTFATLDGATFAIGVKSADEPDDEDEAPGESDVLDEGEATEAAPVSTGKASKGE